MKALLAGAVALTVGLAASHADAGTYRIDTVQSPMLPVNQVTYQPYIAPVVPVAPTVTYYGPTFTPAPAVIYGPAPVIYPAPARVIVRRPFLPRRVYVGW